MVNDFFISLARACSSCLISVELVAPFAGASLQLVPISVELVAPFAGASLQLVPNICRACSSH